MSSSPQSQFMPDPTRPSTSALTSPHSFRSFLVAPLNDRGDLRLTIETQANDQLAVDLRPIEARGLIEHLRRTACQGDRDE